MIVSRLRNRPTNLLIRALDEELVWLSTARLFSHQTLFVAREQHGIHLLHTDLV